MAARCCAAVLSMLCFPGLGLRIADSPGGTDAWIADSPGGTDAWTASEQPDEGMPNFAPAAGAKFRFQQSQSSLMDSDWFGWFRRNEATTNSTTAMPSITTTLTRANQTHDGNSTGADLLQLKMHISGAIVTTSFDDLALNFGFEWLELISLPSILPWYLAFLFTESGLSVQFEQLVREGMVQAATALEGGKAMAKQAIRDALLESNNVFVASWVPQELKEGLAETAIDLMSKARIGFLVQGTRQEGRNVSMVLEIPWIQSQTSAQLCNGLAQVGPQTAVFLLPFILISCCVVICQMKRTAILVLAGGCILFSGPVFRPVCTNLRWGMMDVPDQRLDIDIPNITNVTDQFNIPTVFGFRTSFDEDGFRVYTDYFPENIFKEVAEASVIGLSFAIFSVEGFNLDYALEEYQIELFPSCYLNVAMDFGGLAGGGGFGPPGPPTAAPLPPNECKCARKVLFFCPFGQYDCSYRLRMVFTGSVGTGSLDSWKTHLNVEFINATNSPNAIQEFATNADARLMVPADKLFRNKTDPLEEEILNVQNIVAAMLHTIVDDPNLFNLGISLIPNSFLQDFREAVTERINSTRLHFDSDGTSVNITAEVPQVATRVASSLCDRTAEMQYQPYRFIPFAVIAALLLLAKLPRTALAIAGVSFLLTTAPVTRLGCETVAPRILGTPQQGNVLVLPNVSAALNVSEEALGFPPSIAFTTVYQQDKFLIAFEPLPSAAFEEAAQLIIRNAADPEAYIDVRTELIMQGYRVDFSMNSFVEASSTLTYQR